MRIWLLKDGDPLPTDGENIRLLRMGLIAQKLAEKGHQVIWWTSTLNHAKKAFRTTEDKDISIYSNYIIKLLHGPGYKKNVSIQRILHNRIVARKFLSAAQSEVIPNIILAALPTVELAKAATSYGKQYNVPVVLDLRDMWPDIMVDIMPKILQPFARLVLSWQFCAAKRACKDASALFGITSGFLQWGLNYAGRKRNAFDAVYPLAYSDAKPKEVDLDKATGFWRQYNINSDKKSFVVVYVGSLVGSHKLSALIEILKKSSNDLKFIVAGDGPFLKEYQEQAQGCSNIIFTGWIDKPKLWVLLRMASVGVALDAQRKDYLMSISNKVAEYFSAGLPVLSNLPETSELGKMLLENESGFCFNELDSGSFAEVLNKCRDDGQLLKNISKNARDLYEKMFVAEKVYANMCNHLENIANNKKGST
ncbi:conserved hypothetical protein [Gammaproteobacteria bacterium]